MSIRVPRSLLALTSIAAAMVAYFTLVHVIKRSAVVEAWPLDNIVLETTMLLAAIPLLAMLVFGKRRASVVLTYIIAVIMLVCIPLLKYPNQLWLYGPWDSSAHYSFTLWIVTKGTVPSNNELFYSSQYGHHPGNGLLPAVLSIVARLSPPSISMAAVLATSYVVYALLLVAFVTPSKSDGSASMYLTILAVLLLFTFYSPFYGGFISYAFVSLMVFALIKSLYFERISVRAYLPLIMISFLGLLATHLSTAVIMLSYSVMIALWGFAARDPHLSRSLFSSRRREMIKIALLLTSAFLAYELYVDIYLAGLTIRSGIRKLLELYIQELRIVQRVLEYNPYISIIELITYLISQYAKQLIILFCIAIYVTYSIVKDYIARKSQISTHDNSQVLLVLLVLSLPTWLLGWFGVGNFMSGVRALMLIQFVFCVNLLRRLISSDLFRSLFAHPRRMVTPLIAALCAFGFITNYSIHVGPFITSLEGDRYTYPAGSQGAITPYALDVVLSVNRFLAEDGSLRFLCVQPYTGFGLCDLLWNKPKIPSHGFVTSPITTSEAMVNLLSRYAYASVVIPLLTSDRVLPGPIGYASLYQRPLLHFITYGRGVIYSNGFCILVVL